MCKECNEAADAVGISQKERNKLHKKCIAYETCTCQHKKQGAWKGVGNEQV